MSGFLEAQIEFDRGVGNSRLFKQHYRTDQFAIAHDRSFAVVSVRVAFEIWIGSKIQLCNQGFVSWRRDQVVNMLCGSVGIMPRHYRLQFVSCRRFDLEFSAVSIPLYVV